MLRIVNDHFEAMSSDTPSILKGMMENGTDVKVNRVCVIVYDSGRYRMEKSKQMYNAPLQSQVYVDSLTDAQMLTMLTGRERTRAEYTELLHQAGFNVKRVVPTAAANVGSARAHKIAATLR